MKLTLILKNDNEMVILCDNYEFQSGYLAVSNPRYEGKKNPQHDGMYISCSEIKMISVDK